MAEQIDRLREGLTGQYEVDRAVGQGGMATVYLARDLRHERKVAIKVLKPELAASIGHERFLREIKLAAQLQHPNILGFYESGEAGGLVYYVMPFVEGESLRDRIDKEKQLPIEDAVRIVRESAEALGYAHSHGIVHRDIKPENILLLDNHALVADFGIAKAVEAAGGEKLTETGMAVGTPHYMSPEQALGGAVDGRSDQYSLACVLYECLIGQTPFDGPSPMAVLARHAMEQVPSMQVVRNAIPDSVEDVVFRAMEKTPADRFPSMKEFVEALEDAEADVHLQRTSARRAPTAPRTAAHRTPGVRRATTPIEIPARAPTRPWPVLAGGALALLALVGGGFVFVKGRGAKAPMVADASSDARRVAVLYFQSAADDSLRLLADGLTEGLIRELTPVQALNVVSRNGVAQFRGQNVPRDSIGRILGVGTLVEGNVERDGSQLRVTVRLIDAASGAEFQRTSFEQPAGSYLTLADSLSQKAALLLRERLGVEVRLREQRQRTSNPQAWVLVQRASALRSQVDSLARQDPEAASRALDQADSLLGAAIALDAKWPEPLIMRGGIASQRVRLANRDPIRSAPFIQQGLSAVEQALMLEPQDADALFQRGDLRYWRHILGLESDPAAAKQLVAGAQADFLNSVKINPLQAQAWASLAHLYGRSGSPTDVNLAARRAYEADAYLSNIDVVIDRLFLSSYDLGQFPDAQHWCQEGTRRFPGNWRFAMCRLLLLTTRAEQPDVSRAWRLRDSVELLAPESQREFRTLSAQMGVATVLARAKLPDSARSVITRSRGNPEIDASRDLLLGEAIAQTALDDKDAAFRALKAYWAANPDRQQSILESPGWELQGLATDPRWQRMAQ